MESYFQAAVCDLDKLLDDFEQNTGELESCTAVAGTPDVNYHSFSSELLYFKPETHSSKLEHGKSSSTTSDSLFAIDQTATSKSSLEELKSLQKEKNVTGLDLLSTVDGGCSDEVQSSSLGRGGVLVCDLISDTGKSICANLSPDSGKELHPDDVLSRKDYLPVLHILPEPSQICTPSLGYDASSSSGEPVNGEMALSNELHVTVQNLGLADLKMDGYVRFETSELCSGDSRKTISCPVQERISISCPAEGDSNVMLLSTPGETTAHQVKQVNKKIPERTEHQIISGEEEVTLQKQNASEALQAEIYFVSEECKTSNQQEEDGGVEGNNAAIEEHSVTERKTGIAPLTQVCSASNPSSEEVHNSLSCLPIAVALCGSLVSIEYTDSVIPTENSTADQDPVPQHAGMVNGATSDVFFYEASEHCRWKEERPCLNEAYQTVVEKEDSSFSKPGCSEAKDTVGLPHFHTSTSFSGILETELETVNLCPPKENKINERTHNGVGQNVKFEDDMSMGEILITDAELDAFLNEQFANPFEDSLAEIAEIDASLSGILHVEDYISAEGSVQSENETSMEVTHDVSVDGKICSTDGSLGLIDAGYESKEKKLAEPNVSENDLAHIADEALTHTCEASGVHITGKNQLVYRGARPKHSFDVYPQMVCVGEPITQSLPCTASAGTEQLVSNYEGSPVVLSDGDTDTSFDPNTNFNCDGMETILETEESLGSAITEPSTECMKGTTLGEKQPSWVPDSEAPTCMNCQLKFTFTKRRHHCRACGKVFCASCCNRKCKLQYMEKEARVCVLCHDSISKGPKEQKRVWFADGVLPNGELADTAKLSTGSKRSSQDHSPLSPMQQESLMVASPTAGTFVPADEPTNDETSSQTSETEKLHGPASFGSFTITGFSDYRMLCGVEKCVSKDICLLPEDESGLPPLLLTTGEKGGDAIMEERPCHKQLMSLLEEGGPNPLTFILNANLLVNVKLITFSSEKCWFFSTNGLHAVGQSEIVILLLCLLNEDTLPKDIFKIFLNIYKDALKGKNINNLENITFNESFLDSKDHGGFLFITPTFQNLESLPLPNSPFLCGILIQKAEVPWAKVFPIRLMLRLGAEYGVYPSPVVSIRNRKPLFGDIGHTIMNLLADLRNYQYTLPNIDGLVIHMEMGSSCIKLPLKRYNEILKVINSSNEHVISIGANFSMEADSHLVCSQNDDGIYQTQANSKSGQPRKVTGASFVIFNGALKTSSGFLAKSSIVEDGLMVQITPETMEGLRQALREKKDFKIACGKADAAELKEDVNIYWVDVEDKTNRGVTSPIDGQSLEGITSDKIIQDSDFEPDDKLVKCTEVFYHLINHDLFTSATYYQFAKEIAAACSSAFCENFRILKEHGMNRIALRISMDIDMVEYQAGSWGQLLPQHYLNDLDSALIPVIHGRTSDSSSLPLVMELMFFLIENLI